MNVFLVTTPLQLINAVEAKVYFATHNNVLIVIRNTSEGYPISMFKRLISDSDWESIVYLATDAAEHIRSVSTMYWTYLTFRLRLRLDRLAEELGTIDNLFLGQYQAPITRHFSNVIHYKKLYIIDDGTLTIETNSERKANPQHFFEGNVKAKIKHLMLGLKNYHAEHVTFFTAYEIDTRPSDKVILNRYIYFQGRVASVPYNDEVWFLGQPLIRNRYVTEATYLSYLERIRDHYRDRPFVYLPHSREQFEDVRRISTLIGCEVRRFGVPIEFVLRDENPRPNEVISFFSAALPNCRIIFGNTLQLTSVYLAPETLSSHHAEVKGIYEHFRQICGQGFRILDFNQSQN